MSDRYKNLHSVFLGGCLLVDAHRRGIDHLHLLTARLMDERAFDATTVEREITAPDSNKKILEEIKVYAQEHEQTYGRFPKTLIFAANDLPHTSHADQLVDQARDIFGRGDSFVQKITGSPAVDRPLQRIREFPRLAGLGRPQVQHRADRREGR